MADDRQAPRPGEGTLRDAGKGIDAPRLTPQGRTDPDVEGSDETAADGSGAKTGQPDKAEG